MADQTVFPLDLGPVPAAALLLSILFVRLKLPIVSEQVLAGVIVGPSILGFVRDPTTINDIASIGIVLLLFIGLEHDAPPRTSFWCSSSSPWGA